MRSYWGVEHGEVSKAHIGGGVWAPVTQIPKATRDIMRSPGYLRGRAASSWADNAKLKQLQGQAREKGYTERAVKGSQSSLHPGRKAQDARIVSRMRRKGAASLTAAGKSTSTFRTRRRGAAPNEITTRTLPEVLHRPHPLP